MLNEKLYTYREFVLNEANNDIFTYVRMNNIEKIKQYIEEGRKLNILSTGQTLLEYTIINSYDAENILKLFIEAGADINYQNYVGNTALMIAVGNDKERIVKFLIDNKADVNIVNNRKQSALFMLRTNQSIRCAQLLIDASIDVNLQDDERNTALIYFCKSYVELLFSYLSENFLKIIKFLLSVEDIDLTIKNKNQKITQDYLDADKEVTINLKKLRDEILLKSKVISTSNKSIKNSGIF